MAPQKFSGKNSESRKERKGNAAARANVSLYARGNTGIQTDHFVTHSEKEKRKSRILSFCFS
jgi:hypothetical protein